LACSEINAGIKAEIKAEIKPGRSAATKTGNQQLDGGGCPPVHPEVVTRAVS
jgi:hypothetical protein